ncbi:uncharacterized protein LOC110860669 isoform X1 [Folsomia candida]|uniref:uncharacterized protein LOC110860669 isoform X1 n=1 Tax=Folsomia candida TaxID=158441 RepID=UPI001604D9FA|nr:uncharacterized protein LOC110860669 isoform X1 [Folsomia candida]XP_035716411.1 uncharacterized protein LOC110860669 isoform X1 [Folsomia candida]
METSHQICIILMLIIIVSAGESGLSPDLRISPQASSLIAEPPPPHRAGLEGCHFPVRWEGNWFQSGVHQTITINRNTINTKGRCLEMDGEKYLVYNEKENCYRCGIFHERHYNLITYKETFCITERTSIENLCRTDKFSENLYSMFRLDAVPIDCPFRAPMTFTYNECRNPVSSIEACLKPSQLLFNYQACADIPGSESTVEELSCLGSWKEGSYRYLVGLISYQHHASYEERFRCFVYEKVKKGSIGLGLLGHQGYSNSIVRSSPLTFNSTSSSSSSASLTSDANSNNNNNANSNTVLYRISVGADATCDGLSPYEGSRTMTFRRAVQPPKQCYFPSWLQIHARWHTLDQRTLFMFNSTVMRMANGSKEHVANIGTTTDLNNFANPNVLTSIALCSQIVENPSPDEYTVVLQVTSSQCFLNPSYICSRIVRRDTHIVEMQMGTLTRQADDACHPINFNANQLPYTTLTSSNSAKKRCPSLGHFGITSLAQEGRSVRDTCKNGHRSFSVGCSSKNTMEFRVLCNTDAHPEVVSEYACHGWWEENGINYLITTLTSRSISSPGPRKYCFIYRDMPIPLESKTYQEKLKLRKKSFIGGDDELFQDHDFQRIMQFSAILDSCSRDVSPGIEGFLAFNVTSKGRCNDISGSSIPTLLTDLWLLATIVQMVIAMQ